MSSCPLRRAGLLLCLVLSAGCKPSSGSASSSSAAAPTATAAAATAEETQRLLYGDAALKKQLQQALQAKGPDYVPRTKHRGEDGRPTYCPVPEIT